MSNSFDLPMITDATGKPVSVIVPLDVWNRLTSGRDVSSLLNPPVLEPPSSDRLPWEVPVTSDTGPLSPEMLFASIEQQKPQLDLPDEYLRIVLESLNATLPGMEVWAYGDRAIGNSNEASDLDLAVRSPNGKPIPFELFNAAQASVMEVELPIIVQMVDWARMTETFRREIKGGYVVLSR